MNLANSGRLQFVGRATKSYHSGYGRLYELILHHFSYSEQQLISIKIWISLQLLTHLRIKILGTLIPWIWNHVKGVVICAIMIPLWNFYLLGPLLVCYLKSLIIDMRIYISKDPLN